MQVYILLSVIAVAFASLECGENQHYESCGTACPLTCENYANPPRACVLMCNPGCHCDDGYVKTLDGRCVRPEQCSAASQEVCGENERYNGCGTACPLTCDNYANPPKVCVLMCKIGCECEEGFVRTRDGRCVRPESCPSQAAVQKTCLDKPDSGMCDAYFPMWYYDVKTEKCHKFVYGGCQGNGNRYRTEEECMDHCGDVLNESSPNKCELPAERGLCLAFMPRFHFNQDSGRCEEFIYGGCGGNLNNFKTLEDCQNSCGGALRSNAELCGLEAEPGMCRGYFPRYHYDAKTGECQKFIYGGCGGNANNFKTLEKCQESCA